MYTSYTRHLAAMCALAFAFAASPAGATIDASLQMQLGNPSGATADPANHQHYLIQRTVEAIDYNDSLGEPNWASWDLTAADLGSSGRSPDFVTDTSLPPGFYEVTTDDYGGSGYDRGHMCPSADRTDNDADNLQVFLMSNIIPQAPQNNEGVWATFEGYCRTLAQSGNELLITCGPGGFNGSLIQPGYRAQIGAYTWKIVVVVPVGAGTALSRITTSTRVIAVKIPNNASATSSWQSYVTSARQIEADTGFSFFTALSPDIADVLRDQVDGQADLPPGITSFSPGNGPVNTSVVITGNNFGQASEVTFGGVSASFTVNSATQITALVPRNAPSGTISVTIPTGTARSADSFTITGSTVDLAVVTSHFGNFSQGDTGDTYTINVTNVGTVPSTGLVTVSDMIPGGLTATAISGVGWTVNMSTLVCTRSNALYAGAGYPPISVTINVSASAPSSVTNVAVVANGGDANAANNTAKDPTQINVAASSANAITLAGWNTSTLSGGSGNFGPSPFSPVTNAQNVVIGGLTRGSGVTTGGSGAARGWGGVAFSSATEADAINANKFVSFQAAAAAGYKVSFTSISRFDYRRSNTGPANGVLQYQIGSGAFVDVTSLNYSSTDTGGASLSPVNLAGIPDLQNISAGTTVTFRIVNYGGGASGTWYIYDVANSAAVDFEVKGVVTSTNAADLTVDLVQSGNFSQGDTGDSYSINVTNAGSLGTAGAVTVVAQPPAGFNITSLGGSGWTANLATLTCTRSESLPAGAGYPPITVLVDIATNAPESITNRATVSGGGEINLANNTVSKATSVIQLTPVQFWRIQWFGSSANSGAAADTFVATGDGMPNLLKYAFGLNPLIPAANPVTGDISTGHLRVTAPENPAATDVIIMAETAADLQAAWTTNGITTDQNGAGTFQAHCNAGIGSAGAGYLRLKVIRP